MNRIERMQDVVERLVTTITDENNAITRQRLLEILDSDSAQGSTSDCTEAAEAFQQMKAKLLTEMRSFCQTAAGLVSKRDPAAAGEFAMLDEHISIKLQEIKAETETKEGIPE